jgi:hypothetical protein
MPDVLTDHQHSKAGRSQVSGSNARAPAGSPFRLDPELIDCISSLPI